MMFLFIIGSPRSGTSFLTDYIGKHTDHTYNEPWSTHPLESPKTWKFPKSKTITFKYCENWKNIHTLTTYCPNSFYIHVWRDPDSVIESMAHPKNDSLPHRNLYSGHYGKELIKLCIQRWYSNMIHCLSIYNIVPKQYLEIRYEDILPGIKQLGEATQITFDLDRLKFKNKNSKVKHEWDLSPVAKQLYTTMQDFPGGLLAPWINKVKPKLLQRIIL